MVRTLKTGGRLVWDTDMDRSFDSPLAFKYMAYDSVQYDAKDDDNYCTNKNNPVCLRHH